jgi:hypothetical protein
MLRLSESVTVSRSKGSFLISSWESGVACPSRSQQQMRRTIAPPTTVGCRNDSCRLTVAMTLVAKVLERWIVLSRGLRRSLFAAFF